MNKMTLHPDDFLKPICSICILEEDLKEAYESLEFWENCEKQLIKNEKYFEVKQITGLDFYQYKSDRIITTNDSIERLKDGINQLKHHLN